MNYNNLDFITYCIGNLSRRLGMTAGEVYRKLKQSGILTEYIIPCYDVLHTFGKEYLMEEAMDIFYNSPILPLLEEGVADLHCRSDKYLAEEIWREFKGEA